MSSTASSERRRSGGAAPPPPPPPPPGSYFYEDEVYRVGSKGRVRFGLVLDNCEATSSESSDDGGADPPLQKGDLRVVWHPSGLERVVSDKSVGLADRALMPGDVVRRMIKGKDTQRGYCRDILVAGAVQLVGTNLVLPAIPSERLQPLEEFTADLAVCLDSWVGTSKAVHSKLRLVSADGSRAEFPDANACPLEDCLQRRRRGLRGVGFENHGANEFYPGQTVVGPMSALDDAVWSNVTKEMEAARRHKMREQKFIVESVETESVGVHWQCRALGEQIGAGPPQQPRFLVEGEDLKRLKLLNLFEPCTLQVGAKNFLTLTADDTFCTKAQWKKTQNKMYRALRKQFKIANGKPKKAENKDEEDDDTTHAQDPSITSNHTFRIPGKPKKRLSAFNRDAKYLHYNLQNIISQESKNTFPKESNDCANKEEQNSDTKMDVDIVIMDDEKGLNAENNVPKDEMSNSDVTMENVTASKNSISTQRSHEGPFLDVPEKNCNGRLNSLDRSYSPDYIDISDRQKKMRKSRVSSTNDSRSSSPAVYNGGHKSPDFRADFEDSDSWGNASSDEATDTDSCATWSSQCSSSTNNSTSGRGKKSPHLVTKFLKGKRLKRTSSRLKISAPPPKTGDRVVVETLCTKSKANVVWQDGSIEFGIPSTDLYPIHHLDGQECFPGDFVISGGGTDSAPSHRDYGVVQKVDHYGRTAIVKWFRTYTSCQEPIPQFVSESEVSVYDLKDHPDFQYRPGTVVIRVANFNGTEATCTAGQVMDNFPSGRVHVWWVDGHKSMCWPQDLYKVGEYDSEDGEMWGEEGSSSEDSWETQSSTDSGAESKEKKNNEKHNDDGVLYPDVDMNASIPTVHSAGKDLPKVPAGLEPRAAAHIERGLNAMARMEEILSQNPSLQSHEIMRKLLTLYKDCRFLDRLMGTSFFHEDHFQGLIERVRERGGNCETISGGAGVRRVHDQVMRLFSRDESDGPENSITADKTLKDNMDVTNSSSKESSDSKEKTALDNPVIPQVEIGTLSSNESHGNIQISNILGSENSQTTKTLAFVDPEIVEIKEKKLSSIPSKDGNYNLKEPAVDSRLLSTSSDDSFSKYNTPIGSMGDLSNQNDKSPNRTIDKNRNDDSGIDSQSISISRALNDPESEVKKNVNSHKIVDKDSSKNSEPGSSSDNQLSNRNVCLKLCSLITIQLMKACTELSRRRNSLFVPFLNSLMKEKFATGDPLAYRFFVKFDALVVKMTNDEEDISENNTCPESKIEETTEDILKVEDVDMTKEDQKEKVACNASVGGELGEGFTILDAAPTTHRFRLSLLQPSEPRAFHQAVSREIKLLKSDLPSGVWVRGYEDRMDLLSIMIAGPAKTPYEDGLFLFDVQLGGEYPRAPPLCHYISYCSDRLNPNLYEDGKVCVSLLGTWSGKGVEVWGRDSSLLQVIVSLQGLILCAEPYFNEAGFEKQKGSQQGSENSRMYNEMVLLKLVQSLTKLILHPPDIFKSEIFAHQSRHASGLCDRLTRWMIMSEEHNAHNPESPLTPDTILSDASKYNLQPPEYPLIPASRGFCLTLRSSLESYRNALSKVGISFEKTL